jgi:hypothetical protein
MFFKPSDEKELLDSLAAIVQEFGREAITVHLPAAWVNSKHEIGVKTLYDTTNTIEYEINYNGQHFAKKMVLNVQT